MVVKLSSQKLLKTLYSLKTITKLLILSSILLIGMDIINSYLLNDLEEPPQEIDGGEIKEQIIVIGRGQVLTIKAWSRYTLRLIITSDHATSRKNGLYQEYSVTENSLYDHSGSQFSYRFNASNYTIILLYWNNSILVDTTTPNQIEAHFTISGLDYDVIIVSSLFIILAIFFEILSKLIGRITKKETFLNKQDYSQILSYDYNNSLSETRLKFPSRFRKVFLLGKREMTNFPDCKSNEKAYNFFASTKTPCHKSTQWLDIFTSGTFSTFIRNFGFNWSRDLEIKIGNKNIPV